MIVTIIDYCRDDESHWIAKLSCGHTQHVRHHPPFFSRPWVLGEEGRRSMLGTELNCPDCDEANGSIEDVGEDD